jgi:hypothetical protein
MDVEKFVRHLCRLVLRHQMPVWNYFVNSFYSVGRKMRSILRTVWLVNSYLMKKSSKVLLNFGLDCGMWEFFSQEP